MADINTNRIASVDVAASQLTEWVDFAFSQPPEVVQGHAYVIVLALSGTFTATGTATWGQYNFWQGEMTDSYPRGRAFGCGSGCPSFTIEPEYRDMEFETYISPLVCQ